METRTRNKTAHPGLVTKTAHRRTTAEVQQERTAKAQAKAAREETKHQSIERAAAFEHAEKANEDMVDATPRPTFTSKPWPPPRNRKTSHLIPVAKTSDVEMSDEGLSVKNSDTTDDSEWTDEHHEQSSRAKKKKVQLTEKATARGAKTMVKKKQLNNSDVEIVAPSDEETPKPKKKVKVRDDINIATKKLEANEK